MNTRQPQDFWPLVGSLSARRLQLKVVREPRIGVGARLGLALGGGVIHARSLAK